MEVHTWDKEKSRRSGFMVVVNEIEAIQIAENLLHQILVRCSNHNRIEFTTKDDEYFSIALQTNKEVNDNFFNKPII
jgi:hypothetical protein